MSDHEDVEEFEAADSGASLTYPMEAGAIRKGGHLVIKGRPCKVRARAAPLPTPAGRVAIPAVARSAVFFSSALLPASSRCSRGEEAREGGGGGGGGGGASRRPLRVRL